MALKRIRLLEQVKNELIASIGAGEFMPGAKMQSVRQISRNLNVSHVTAATALKELAEEGILETRQGAGTFVSEKLPYKMIQKKRMRNSSRTLYFFFRTLQSAGSYHNSILCAIQQEAEKRGWATRIGLLTPEEYEFAAEDPDAAGIVFATTQLPLKPTSVPVINYGMAGKKEIPSVTPDNYGAGYAAGTYLLRKGIETVYFITIAPREEQVSELQFPERYHGLRDAFLRIGKPEIPLLHWAINHPCRKEVETLISNWKSGGGKEYPVLIIGNRSMATEIYIYLSAVGLRVPEDIGILTFIRRNSSDLQAPLDTFDFDHRQMGEQIMFLLDQAQKNIRLPSRILVPMTLIEEGSVRGTALC